MKQAVGQKKIDSGTLVDLKRLAPYTSSHMHINEQITQVRRLSYHFNHHHHRLLRH